MCWGLVMPEIRFGTHEDHVHHAVAYGRGKKSTNTHPDNRSRYSTATATCEPTESTSNSCPGKKLPASRIHLHHLAL